MTIHKDKDGTELTRGDLVMVTIDTPVRPVAELVVFIDMEEYVHTITVDEEEVTKTTKTLTYYPLTEEGLEVANFDSNVTQSALHRQQKYTLSNIESKHMLKMRHETLNDFKKDLYDSILAVI